MNNMVSVIIPVYDREYSIGKCIDSVIGQTYKDLEIILIDDGSADKTGSLCDEYAQKDGRVQVIHQANLGVAEARNNGLKKAKGDFVTFLDSDDYIAPSFIEQLLEAVLRDGSVMSLCNYYEMYDGDRSEKKFFKGSEISTGAYIDDMLYGRTQGGLCWGKMYPAGLIKTYFENYKYCEDVCFVFHYLIDNPGRISIVSSPLYYYYRHKNGITGTKKASDLKDSVLVAEYIYDKCKSNGFHDKAACAFLTDVCHFAYLQTSKDKNKNAVELRIMIKSNILHNRLSVICDRRSSIKSKGACTVSLLSYKLLELLYKFL